MVLTVSPDWEELDHLGAVSARVFPGSSIACPHVTQDSVVRVRLLTSTLRDDSERSPEVFPPVARPFKRSRGSQSRSDGQDPLAQTSTEGDCTSFQSSSSDGLDLDGEIRVTPSERRKLREQFRREAKLARLKFKEGLVQE